VTKSTPILSVLLDDVEELVGFQPGDRFLPPHGLDGRLVMGTVPIGTWAWDITIFPYPVEIAPGAQVHDRVSSRLLGYPELLQFLVDVHPLGRRADIGIDLVLRPSPIPFGT
jgi:hypothetical protein